MISQQSLLDLLDQRTIDLFAGPGGWDEGAKILGFDLGIEGIEWSRDAVATARAAGHRRRLVDVRAVDPMEYHHCTGLIASPPCPTFSDGGTRSGRGSDYQHVLDVWTSIGWGIPVADALADLESAGIADERTKLLATAGVWALALMTSGSCEWVAFEQVPAVEFAWEDLAAEFFSIGCEYVNVGTLDAVDFGLPSRRKRAYLVASTHGRTSTALDLASSTNRLVGPGALPYRGNRPELSMAEALGWEPGHRVITRGNRRPSGGNAFPADRPSWCLTGKARSWEREDGMRLAPAQAGFLSGFPQDYPWTGSRSSAFQQAGDVVSPVMAAHVLAGAIGIDAGSTIDRHLDTLYAREWATAA